jgi:hypothetical protein
LQVEGDKVRAAHAIFGIDVKYNAMLVLLTFILLVLSILVVVALRLIRRGSLHTWLITVGVLLTWGSVLLWQFNLPWRLMPVKWMPAAPVAIAPLLFADSMAWYYALSLIALTAAIILTSAARSGHTGTSSWPEMLALGGLAVLSVLVDSPFGLALVWMLIDLAQFMIAVRRNTFSGEQVRFSFGIQLIATALILWAGVVGASSSTGQTFSIETAPSQAGIFLLLAAILRISTLPFRLVDPSVENVERRGFDTILWMASAVASLALFARVPIHEFDPRWLLVLLLLSALAALVSGWKWLFAPDELQGRASWFIGLSALSLVACLSGNPAGSVAWGVFMILFGGILFLYSVRQIWLTRIFVLASLFMLSLPFTLTASAWFGNLPLPFLLWPIFVLAHAMFAAGYLRHLFHPSEVEFAQLPNWSQATYVLGMGLLLLTILLGSIWGWAGALKMGVWTTGVAVLLFSGIVFFASFYLPRIALLKPLIASGPPSINRKPSRLAVIFSLLARVFSFFYQLIGSLSIYLSDLLEGDGGLLWTLLLLILLISFIRGN